ncbi:Sucrose-6F-phosphate phosphohydrolase/haloacid dehalogenase-like hydrolase [Novymonas esmeraldas]|uniref:Sucrose-6F-phosphate phosphohydrolase/haloacid dehalogenase-like hydrolase n=1 Tax=Novymonas esmeraldas TaxID=1808958 RepID=A0AAW0EPP2_9TRYP
MMDAPAPFRIVASDMDGTVLNSSHDLSPYTMETLLQLSMRHGVEFVFATGRHHLSVDKARSELSAFFATRFATAAAAGAELRVQTASPGFFLVTSNGARIHDPAGKLIVAHDLDPDVVRTLYREYGLPYTLRHGPDVVLEHAVGTSPSLPDAPHISATHEALLEGDDENPEEVVSTSAYTTDEWFITAPFMPLPEMEKKFGVRPYVVPFDAADPANAAGSVFDGFPVDGVGKVCFRCSDRHILDAMERRIREQFGDRVSVAMSSTRCLDVMASRISKASALDEIVKLLSARHGGRALTMKDVIAFGDSMNDEVMLERVGKGCVMANAQERLKRTLPKCEVIGNNDADGVAVKLREVFGIMVDV